MMTWTVITFVVVASPVILIWGWLKYLRIPRRDDWRSRASLFGLCGPVLSLILWTAALLIRKSYPAMSAIHVLSVLGVWVPILGATVALVGRPRLLLAIVPSCLGAVLFWFGTTLP